MICKFCKKDKSENEFFIKKYSYFDKKVGYIRETSHRTKTCLVCYKVRFGDVEEEKTFIRKSNFGIPEWILKNLKEYHNCFSRKKYPDELYEQCGFKVRHRIVEGGYAVEVIE